MFDKYIEALAKKSGLKVNEGDYIQDGLIYCGTCKEPRQGNYTLPNGKKIMPEILCKCGRQKRENGRIETIEAEKQARKEHLQKGMIEAERFTECIFENDDGRQPEVTNVCQNYVNTFREMRERGFGLILYGERGKGKSFYAACIANALIDKGYPILFGTLANLVMRYVDGIHGKAEPLNVKDYDLVVIDDLGVENASQTAFTIVDSIYANKIPMIVTTNLMPQTMKGTTDLARGRIYDRLFEACPIGLLVANNGGRARQGKDNLKEMMEIMKNDRVRIVKARDD